ncbi:hypothetical protein [Achromobacter piechaudii]|uniref:hypothetical protein n=1 Tax=Achromobacter piechaudii TaxID=72556 RepID=UPI001582DB54|nr:hypothetical protein [Achromobacter piechaudii]
MVRVLLALSGEIDEWGGRLWLRAQPGTTLFLQILNTLFASGGARKRCPAPLFLAGKI